MSTNSTVSYRALRLLTYTIICKAVIDAVMLIGRMTALNVLYTIAKAAGFINIVACIVCLVGIITLSGKMVSTFRVMVIVLILDCVSLLLFTLDMRLAISDYTAEAAVIRIIALISIAAERLLIGAAFLFLMKGFGEILRAADDTAAAACEKLGMIYLCCNSAGTIAAAIAELAGAEAFRRVAYVLFILVIILEFLMARRSYDAAFRIWRMRTSDVPESRGR